jgi:hopene-associated glycosyltransferase HpnB
MLVVGFAAASLAAWIAVLLLPSRPWSTRERIDAGRDEARTTDLGRVTVLIPARNEAAAIGGTLSALARQGRNLAVVLVDDESDDDTTGTALRTAARLDPPLDLTIVRGQPLPPGWGGKLWALEQGLGRVDRDYCLLLDAEIGLSAGLIGALLARAEREGRAMVSVMARLRCMGFWEKLLVPPFVLFFKLLYPFAAVNAPGRPAAAAAGGCILIRTKLLREIGGFAGHRDALIDDCALAARIKRAGHSIWLGLSHDVRSERAYPDLSSFRHMVARTAFTQLGYSWVLLAAVVLLMLLVFVAPWAGLVAGVGIAGRAVGGFAILAMAAAYWPTVRFYRLSPLWVLSLSVAALLFLAMTLESALNYARGSRAEWKGRNYATRSP